MRGNAEFRRVYREGVRKRSGGVTVIRAGGGAGPARIGFVAGRGVGTAVARNRAKRRLRAAARRVELPAGTACIVVASAAVVDAPFERVVDWMRGALAGAADEAG